MLGALFIVFVPEWSSDVNAELSRVIFGGVLILLMLVLPSGRERTEAEYAKLFAGAGWKLTRVVPTNSPMQVVEGEPV